MKKAIIALATLGCISSKSFALNEYLLVDLNVASKCHATLTYQTPKFKHERELKINLPDPHFETITKDNYGRRIDPQVWKISEMSARAINLPSFAKSNFSQEEFQTLLVQLGLEDIYISSLIERDVFGDTVDGKSYFVFGSNREKTEVGVKWKDYLKMSVDVYREDAISKNKIKLEGATYELGLDQLIPGTGLFFNSTLKVPIQNSEKILNANIKVECGFQVDQVP